MEIPKHLEKHFIKGKIITGLTHKEVKEDFHFEPHGTTGHVAHFPHPGVICQFKLGAGGLQYQRGENISIIPLEELLSLFERVDPKFAEPPNKGLKPARTPAPAAPASAPAKK